MDTNQISEKFELNECDVVMSSIYGLSIEIESIKSDLIVLREEVAKITTLLNDSYALLINISNGL